MLYLGVVRNQHLAGLLDHGLGLELVVAEAVAARVEGLLARHAGQRQVCRVGVKVHHDVAVAVGGRRRSRGSRRASGGG